MPSNKPQPQPQPLSLLQLALGWWYSPGPGTGTAFVSCKLYYRIVWDSNSSLNGVSNVGLSALMGPIYENIIGK